MRLLVCNYEFPPVGGGGGNACKYLAREWVSRGHTVTVVTSNWVAERTDQTAEGARVIRVPVQRHRLDHTRIPELAAYVFEGRREIARLARAAEEFDVVLSFFAVPSGLVGEKAAALFRIPHVIRVGGGDIPGHEKRLGLFHQLLGPRIRALLSRAHARVANSWGLKKRAECAFGLSFDVIENGVALEEFTPDAQGPVHNPPVVLFVSRLIERKGLQFLMPALASLGPDVGPWRLVVVGDGPRHEALLSQAMELGLTDRIEWLGQVAHDELSAIYRRADLFVLPSLSEGMPNVVLEAMASGLPILATRVPGSEELVRDGDNGFLVPAGDIAALGETLSRLLGDANLRRRMGLKSREFVSAYTWSSLAERYLDLVQQVRNE